MVTQRKNQNACFAFHQKGNRFSPFTLRSRLKRLTQWGLGGIALLLMSCQAEPRPLPAPATPPTSETPTQTDTNSPTPSPSASKRYENQQAGIRFAYPNHFVIADPIGNAANEPSTVELWQQEVYDSIVAGKYEGGTEYPPNVQVVIERNPDRPDLQAWVERQSDQFFMPKDFEARSVAGLTGLSFRSTGLYEQENVVVASPDGETVVAISLATIGNLQVDEPNRQAFTQILDSLQLGSPTQP